jgi:hypothetical protein
MRKTILMAVLLAGACVASPAALAQDAGGQPPDLAQMQLTDAQVQQFLAASPEVEAAMGAAPPSQSDAPAPKLAAKLEQIAKKYKFANYGELDTVSGNIMLVLEGVDPDGKKYIGAEAALKKEIAELQANKQIPAEDKKAEIAELNDELKSIVPVKFKSNIDLVLKYLDKLEAEQNQGQK